MSSANQPQPQAQQPKDRRTDILTIQDYLDASGEASRRVRNMILALMVASILTLIALLNSLQDSWMLKRMQRLQSADSEYLARTSRQPGRLPSGWSGTVVGVILTMATKIPTMTLQRSNYANLNH